MIRDFHFSPPTVHTSATEFFEGTKPEKKTLEQIIVEWNCRSSVSELSKGWHKERPPMTSDTVAGAASETARKGYKTAQFMQYFSYVAAVILHPWLRDVFVLKTVAVV